MSGLLLSGGVVVDGTGRDPAPGDVRVRDGRIVEIGDGLPRAGEQVLDASGAFVTPGFIDNHTHIDANLFWDPTLDPLPQHGVTTAVMGNCSLSLAPLRERDRPRVVAAFSFIEDLPEEVMLNALPWNWEDYDAFAAELRRRPLSLNVGQFIGHSALRTFVMGDAAWERAATAEEVEALAAALAACLRAGAFGLSMSFFDADANGVPVPSCWANDHEQRRLIDVLGTHSAVLQYVANAYKDPMVDVERLSAMCKQSDVTATCIGLVNLSPEKAIAHLDRCLELQADGAKIYPQVNARPIDVRINWDTSFTMNVMRESWGRAIAARGDDKKQLLADPEWRALARKEWDEVLPERSPLRKVDRILLIDSPNPAGKEWVGKSLAELAHARGQHVSDVLADWVITHDLNPGVVVSGVANADPDMVAANLRHPASIVGNSDAGAHVQMMCATGDTTLLLTRFVRDRGDLTIGEAIYALTGRQAEVFSLAGRGVVAEGAIADLNVFALDELSWDEPVFVADLPDQGLRMRRPAGGYRWTVVGGEITHESGQLTEARPGRLLGLGTGD